jgi:hypothetical protein
MKWSKVVLSIMIGGTSLQSTTYAMTHNLRGGMLSLHTVASVNNGGADANRNKLRGDKTRSLAQHVCNGHPEGELLCKLLYALTNGNPDAPKVGLKDQVLDEIDKLISDGRLEVVLEDVLNTLGISNEELGAMLNVDTACMLLLESIKSCYTMDTKLVAPDAQSYAHFGHSVAIDGDTIAVGAPEDDDKGTRSGAVYMVSRRGDWRVPQKLVPPANVDADDLLGSSVAISADNLVIGAPNDEKGSVYIVNRNRGAWDLWQRLVGSDVTSDFGASVAISGNDLAVGATRSAYAFRLSEGSWGEPQELVVDDRESGDQFGNSVAIDGDTIVVGSRSDDVDGVVDAGSAYVFRSLEGSWESEQKLVAHDGQAGDHFGHSVAISGDYLVVSSVPGTMNGEGSVYIFNRIGGEPQRILAPDALSVRHHLFGYSVAIEGDQLVVGSPNGTVADDGRGSAYMFKLVGGTSWEFAQKLMPFDRVQGDWFGASVAISGNTVVVGASDDDVNGFDHSGSAWVTTKETFVDSRHMIRAR